MPRNAPYAFTLRSDEKKMVVKTVSLTSVDGTPAAPSGFEYIPFKISNPYKADGNLPVDELGSSLYSVDPRTGESYVYTPSYGPDATRMTYPDAEMVLQLEANKYAAIESVSGWVCPTDTDTFPQLEVSPVTGLFMGGQAAGLHPYYESLGSPHPRFNFVPGPSGVVLPEVQSITDIGGGEYTLVLDKDIISTQRDTTGYQNIENASELCCRFNAPDIGGDAVAPSVLSPTGTFDDPVRTKPPAVFHIESGSGGTTFTITFLRGTPADFPNGQRLRICGDTFGVVPHATVPYQQMGHPTFGGASDAFDAVTGLILLNFVAVYGAGYPHNRNIPWTLPTINAQEYTVGTIGQWKNEFGYMPEDMTMSGIITMRLA